MPTAHAADEAAIREQAYYFWEAEGRPEGRESEFWMRATIALADKLQVATLVKPAPKKTGAAPKAKAVAKPKAEAAAPKKAAASKTKAVPAKAEPAKKPKKK